MKVSKQFSIVLAAAVLAFGAVTVAPQQADASYGYKYLWGKISNYPPYYKQHHRVLFRRPFLLCI